MTRLQRHEEALITAEHAVALPGVTQSTISAWFAVSRAHLELGRIDAAYAAAERAVALDERNPSSLTNLSIVEARRGNREAVSRLLRESARRRPTPDVLRSAARRLDVRGVDREHALAMVDRALALDPWDAESHAAHAHVLVRVERFVEALAAADRAVALAPRASSAHLARARPLLLMRKDADAAIAAERAVELDPQSVEARIRAAQTHTIAGGTEHRAIVHAQAAVALDPSNPEVLTTLYHALGVNGRAAEAEPAIRRALELRNDPDLRMLHARVLAGIPGREAEAVEALESLAADRPDAWLPLGRARLAARDVPGATDAFRRAVLVASGPLQRALASRWLGRALELAGEKDEAIPAFRDAVRLNPTSSEARKFLAHALLWSEPEAARRIAEAAKAEDESWVPYVVGCSHVALGEHRQALPLLRRSVVLAEADGNPNAPRQLALLIGPIHGEREEAVRLLEHAVALVPQYAHAHSNLVYARLRVGDLPGALEAAETAARLDEQFEKDRRRLRRRTTLEPRLDAVIAGDDVPEDADDLVHFAYLADYLRKDYAASTRLFERALALEPRFADPSDEDEQVAAAAEAAARAGPGTRNLALRWMRIDLAHQTSRIEEHTLKVLQTLGRWRDDVVFEAVRDGDGLPAEWQQFWQDVDALFERAKAVRAKQAEAYAKQEAEQAK